MGSKKKIDNRNWEPDPEEQVINGNVVRQVQQARSTSTEFGRARGWVLCPFCGSKPEVFWWSLAGGGKRCYCNALLGHGRALAEIALLKDPTPYQPKEPDKK